MTALSSPLALVTLNVRENSSLRDAILAAQAWAELSDAPKDKLAIKTN